MGHGLRGTDDDHIHHLSHNLIHMVMSCAMLYMYWLGMPITAAPNVEHVDVGAVRHRRR